MRESAVLLTGKLPVSVRGAGEIAAAHAVVRSAYADGFRTTMLASSLLALIAAAIGMDRSFRRGALSR